MTVTHQAGFIRRIESLPPLPAVVNRVLAATESPNTSAEDLARILSEDQAIAARILRVANSSFYGLERRVTQVSRAVVMLGNVGVRNLVLGIMAQDALPSSTQHASEHAILWRHSVAVASISDAIARQAGFKPPEEAFIGGLLHDIGQLAMVVFEVEGFREVFREQNEGKPFLALEEAHFGIDHTQAGAYILNRWGLPETMCRIAECHHRQEIDTDAPEARVLAIVMLADTIAHVLGFGFDMPVRQLNRAEAAASLLGLDMRGEWPFLEGLHGRIEEALELFTDAPRARSEPAAHKTLWWVAREDAIPFCGTRHLLEHRGYEVRLVSPDDLGDAHPPERIILLALSDAREEAALAGDLIRRGHTRIVAASDPTGRTAPRHRDPQSGLCRIPWLFTAYDVDWLEEQLES